MQTLTIVGAGRLGASLGRLAQRSGLFQVLVVYCRTEASAYQAAQFIGAGRAAVWDESVELADLTLLAVPDDALAGCADKLAARPAPKGAVVFHASGALDSSLLAPLAQSGLACGSLHPAFSFADPVRAVQTFAGTLCALEGDEVALSCLNKFAYAIGGQPFMLTSGCKAAYHASLAIASNFLVTLTGFAQSVMALASIDEEHARRLLGSMMHQTLNQALTLGAAQALTGPIVRGDVATVEKHLAVMTSEEQVALYKVLGRGTLALVRERLARTDEENFPWARFNAVFSDLPAASNFAVEKPVD